MVAVVLPSAFLGVFFLYPVAAIVGLAHLVRYVEAEGGDLAASLASIKEYRDAYGIESAGAPPLPASS